MLDSDQRLSRGPRPSRNWGAAELQPGLVRITATVRTQSRTGVEMEALTAVAVACLTVVDMGKAVDKAMTIEGVRVLEKHGGRSGNFIAEPSSRSV